MNTMQTTTLRTTMLPAALAVALMLAIPAFADSRDDGYKDTIERQLAFDSGASLILTNKNGSVKIGSWDKEEIKIVAHKKMRVERFGSWFARLLGFNAPKIESDEEARKYLEQFTFEVSGEADAMEIKTVRPSETSGGLQFSMTYEILLPKNADVSVEVTNGKVSIRDIQGEVIAQTTNGSIAFNDVSGNLEARTTNGSVDCEDISGGLQARTVNGGIEVTFDEDAILTEDVTCRNTNGSIELSLPEDAQFVLSARTSSGKIESDFEFSAVEQEDRRRVEATIGNGGPTITLRNTNGGVDIEVNH